jgi:hypothetical protein
MDFSGNSWIFNDFENSPVAALWQVILGGTPLRFVWNCKKNEYSHLRYLKKELTLIINLLLYKLCEMFL